MHCVLLIFLEVPAESPPARTPNLHATYGGLCVSRLAKRSMKHMHLENL